MNILDWKILYCNYEFCFHDLADKPANKWVEPLHVGNGRLGAMIFGSVSEAQIQIS